MLKNFICPNQTITPIDVCMKGCPYGERCAPLSYLRMCADEREWKGKPSVTQLIRGTREAWLKIKKDYSENPQGQVFRIIGSKGHAILEKFGVDAEHPLEWEGITGIPDELEPVNENEVDLIDNKVSGSYKVAKVIGIVAVDTGKRGPKGGIIKEYHLDAETRDFGEWALQFNMYRIMVESNLSFTVRKIKVFMPVRDGNTIAAKSRGINLNFYYEEVPFLPVDEVMDYFRMKRDALLHHLEENTMPEPCTPDEAWNGNKCKDHCSVVELCKDCPYIER